MPTPTQTPTTTEPRALSRRRVLTGLSALALSTALAPVLPTPAAALSAPEAKVLVDKLVGEINKVIASGKSESAMIRDFEGIFDRYADVPTIARYALGADARSASGGQIAAFTEAFRGYISRKYGKRFREFIGGRIEVNDAKAVKSFIEVRTTAHLRGEAPFDVTFLVSDKSGRNLFFNMFIEGVNMLLTERTEIGAMLDREGGNIDKLISAVKKAG